MDHVTVHSPNSNTDREQQPYLKVAGCGWAGQHDEAGGGRCDGDLRSKGWVGGCKVWEWPEPPGVNTLSASSMCIKEDAENAGGLW